MTVEMAIVEIEEIINNLLDVPKIPASAGIFYGDTSWYYTCMKNTVTISNRFQKNYTYIRQEPVGRNFDPDFIPDLTPKDMINIGVFGGVYDSISDKEFPKDWFSKNNLHHLEKSAENNFFKVRASQPLEVWKNKGWIHPQDPHGWFQWYCRYYMGRRTIDDERQIKRWSAFKRHIAQVTKNCKKGDYSCRTKQRQALLHWAYDSRKM